MIKIELTHFISLILLMQHLSKYVLSKTFRYLNDHGQIEKLENHNNELNHMLRHTYKYMDLKIKECTKRTIDYVVIKTGYTSRLWNVPDKNGYATINRDHIFFGDMSNILHSKYHYGEQTDPGQAKYWMEDRWQKRIQILFSYDDVWGTGLYKNIKVGNVDEIIEMMKDVKEFDYGISCFKCDGAMCYQVLINMMLESYYCRVFDITDMKIVSCKKKNITFMVIEFDTESG